MDDLELLLKDVGKTVEDSGRMLQRKPPFTYTELTELAEALYMSGQSILSIRDTYQSRYRETESQGS